MKSYKYFDENRAIFFTMHWDPIFAVYSEVNTYTYCSIHNDVKWKDIPWWWIPTYITLEITTWWWLISSCHKNKYDDCLHIVTHNWTKVSPFVHNVTNNIQLWINSHLSYTNIHQCLIDRLEYSYKNMVPKPCVLYDRQGRVEPYHSKIKSK